MGKNTKIEWADSTASPWYGCRKISISDGCANCYIESVIRKMGIKHGDARVKSKSFAKECRKWNDEAGAEGWQRSMSIGHVPKMFPSLCDWLDPEVPVEWLADMLRVVRECTNLDFLLLTKRPELWAGRLIAASVLMSKAGLDEAQNMVHQWVHNDVAPPNIWVGTSCENQAMADKRIHELLKIPAKVRFLSLEPLLGPIKLPVYPSGGMALGGVSIGKPGRDGGSIDWVIVGGESGPKARPCNIAWIRDIIRQCKNAGVKCFIKQLGSNPCYTLDDSKMSTPIGVGSHIEWIRYRHRKGGDMSECPEDLRVREML